MIAKAQFFNLARAELTPVLEQHRFQPLEKWEGFFYRQRGPFLDYIALGTDRSGEFAHLVACMWVPWMDSEEQDLKEIDPDALGVQVGGEISPRGLRDSWGWEVADVDIAASSLRDMAAAISKFAFPWFDSVNTGSAFVGECARNPGYWRKVTRVDRERIRVAVDQALSGELELGTYGFSTKRSSKHTATPKPSQARSSDAAYEEVSFEHKSDAVPNLKLSLKGLKKKQAGG